MDAKTCFFCSEAIEPGTAKCPFCGEALTGDRAKLRPIGWGSPQKPMTIAVVGWLSIIFGAFGLFGLASSAFMFIFMGSMGGAAPNPMLEAWGPPGSLQQAAMIVSTALGGIASAVNCAGGYGLLCMRPWGRQLAIGVAIYSIVASLIVPLFTLPGTLATMQPPGAAPAPVDLGTIVVVTTLVGVLIGCAIQGLIIFFLTRPHVGAALHRASGAKP